MTAGVHHFFVAPDAVRGDVVEITGDEARHASRVLRLREGERITAADGTGRVVDAVVSEVGDIVRAAVRRACSVTRERPEMVLVQAVPKGDRMDDVITKGVEVGVGRIVPFIASRSIVRWDAARARKACDRWTALALAAAKQSRSAWLTTIGEVVTGLPALDRPAIALHEGASQPLRALLPDTAPDTLTLVIGPEGGLTDEELSELRRAQVGIATLGPRILRTETAGLVAAAIVAHVYGSLG